MQSLVAGGADCGPVNPLSQLTKAYGRDRSLQQDHFSPQAGPSHSGFRSQASTSRAAEADAARFFSHTPPSQTHTPPPFDLTSLNRALQGSPHPHHGTATPPLQNVAPAWARAFAAQEHQKPQTGVPAWAGDFARQQAIAQDSHQQHHQHQSQATFSPQLRYGPHQMGMSMHQPNFVAPASMQQTAPAVLASSDVQASARQWESAFRQQEMAASTSAIKANLAQINSNIESIKANNPALSTREARDALAETAGALLSTVEKVERERAGEGQATTNDKFAKSSFIDLMRKLRDGEVAVEGDKVVEQISAVPSTSSWAGNTDRLEEGRSNPAYASSIPATDGHKFVRPSPLGTTQEEKNLAMAERLQQDYDIMSTLWDDEDQVRAAREAKGKQRAVEDPLERTKEQMYHDTTVPLPSHYWEEDWDPDSIIAGPPTRSKQSSRPSAQQAEWDKLQNDWERYQATMTGIQDSQMDVTMSNAVHTSSEIATNLAAATGYAFSPHNPYTASSHHHSMHNMIPHQTTFDSVLEHEAAVQREPTNPARWLALGIKQQENEREDLAIKALKRALDLDPEMGDAYLALAVSYTNENERAAAYEAVDRWADSLGRGAYPREVDNYRDLFGPLPDTTEGHVARHQYLTGLLIQLAQSRTEDVDADVQIGLGVLFNMSEEYAKASDCFGAALSVRPDDPLLFNRLGATLANSGKTEQSVQYYLEALDLHPAYVRARFNLAVASTTLGKYDQAVEHLMTSLMIQEEEIAEFQDGDFDAAAVGSGVTSQSLWDTLSVALLMLHRSDLAGFASKRDLASLRAHFPSAY